MQKSWSAMEEKTRSRKRKRKSESEKNNKGEGFLIKYPFDNAFYII